MTVLRNTLRSLRLSPAEDEQLSAEAALSGRTVSEVLRSRAFGRPGDQPLRGLLRELNQLGVVMPPRMVELIDRRTGLGDQLEVVRAARLKAADELVERLAAGEVGVAGVDFSKLAGAVEVDELVRRAGRVLEEEIRQVLRADGRRLAEAVGVVARALVSVSVEAGRACAGYPGLLAAAKAALPLAKVGEIAWVAGDSPNSPSNRLVKALGVFDEASERDPAWYLALPAWQAVEGLRPLMGLLETCCGVRVSLWPQSADSAAVLGLVGRLPEPVRLAVADDLGSPAGWHVTSLATVKG